MSICVVSYIRISDTLKRHLKRRLVKLLLSRWISWVEYIIHKSTAIGPWNMQFNKKDHTKIIAFLLHQLIFGKMEKCTVHIHTVKCRLQFISICSFLFHFEFLLKLQWIQFIEFLSFMQFDESNMTRMIFSILKTHYFSWSVTHYRERSIKEQRKQQIVKQNLHFYVIWNGSLES